MRLLFSESKPDYDHYVFPYAMWAFPEKDETAADLFDHGFLPSARDLSRFYLCRQVRVDLRRFRLSSENRRILRKGQGLTATLVPRASFEYTSARREFYKTYTDIRFGKDVMTRERLDALFSGAITSHLLLFTENDSGAEVGTVTLYLQPPALVYYYYAFYDLNYYRRNLGMYMMTFAADFFARKDFRRLYLGSCYHSNALYKTQFMGAEFFNGVRWSANLKELKYLLRRDQSPQEEHLLECEEYRELFFGGQPGEIAASSRFQVTSPH